MPSSSDDLDEALAALRAERGLDYRAVERLLRELARGGGTLSELVRATAVDRREVEVVLQLLARWLDRSGDRYRIRGVAPPDWTVDSRRRARLVDTMAGVRALLPAALTDLDHVSATADTMVDRAVYFAERYALDGATVLLVGDHDLTSVALTLLEPRCEALVVDVDHRLLAFIAGVARDRGLAITTAFADLRLGLPAAFEGRADLAFTDPPYSQDGISLFLTRALAGLRQSGHERVSFAYGFADSQLTRGFRTQSVLTELRLVTEAVLPAFNRFDGAEAIGAAADLYVCRPTRWSWQALERVDRPGARIYTRGSAAVESRDPDVDDDLLRGVLADFGEPVLVGAGWPVDRPAVDLADHLSGSAARRGAAVLMHPLFDASLGSVLVASSRWDEVRVVVGRAEVTATLGTGLSRLLATVAEVTVRNTGTAVSVVTLARRRTRPESDVDAILAFLATRPHSKIANVWREGLVDLGRRRGGSVTKNEARMAIRDAAGRHGLTDLRLVDLPRDGFDALVEGVARSVEALSGPG